ncbi:MAG TPA: phosphatidylserine/phosphatidylglycerophosphate/cardiolipin synthase family protein [Polyangiaceae bacterium]|nr:phosphatidylserine/phosphatidylglycerophosphate/cardiolipin synthase family protein [Polyangiaceae bacterium]
MAMSSIPAPRDSASYTPPPSSGVVRCRRSTTPPPPSGPDAGERYAHRAEPLCGMEEVLDRLNDDVRRARRRIWVGTYIYREGRIGHYFAGMFAHAARRGLDVRVLYDALGSQRMPRSFVERMRAHGVACRPYRPLSTSLREGTAFPREHSRIVLFDDAGYVGGAAWSDEWLPRAWGGDGWRELCCRVEGPTTRAMEAAFEYRWRSAGGDLPHDYECAAAGPSQDVAFVTDTPRPPALLYEMYRARVRAARSRVWLANAYFCPPRGLEADLREAAARGVDVRVIVPGPSNDLPAIRLASLARYGRWLEGGIKLYEYGPAMFHAKYALVDDDWATVGTFNLNPTSLRWVNEANFLVRQRPFVHRLASIFETDLRSCREVKPGDYRTHLLGQTLGRLYSAGLDALDPSAAKPQAQGALHSAP